MKEMPDGPQFTTFMLVVIIVIVMIRVTVSETHAHKLYLQPYEAMHKLQQTTFSSNDTIYYTFLSKVFRQLERGGLLSSALSQDALELSPLCINQSLHVLSSISSPWASQMIDATAKPQRGLMVGITNWLGSFDECLGVTSTSMNTSVHNFTGRYCTAQMPLGPLEFQIGLCLPSGCTGSDATVLAKLLLQLVSANVTGANGFCHEQNVSLSTGAIVTLAVFSSLLLVCILGTLYDLSLHLRPADTQENIASAACVKNDSNGPVARASDTHSVTSSESVFRNDRVSHNGSVSRDGSVTKALEQSILGKLLLCFSVYTNGWKILSTDQPAGSLRCLHGLRFITMTWIILGHTIVFSSSSIATLQVFLVWIQRFSFEAIANASVSVDSFFVLSGLLSAYLLLRDIQHYQPTTGQFFKSIPVLYLHRYVRLTPAYGFMLLFHSFLAFYLFDGPRWPTDVIPDPYCKNNSWTNILYINNLYDPDHPCAAWTWYLANDFQFFLITPFVVYLMYRFPKIGVAFSVLMVLISSSAATAVSASIKMGLGLFAKGAPGGPQVDYFGQYYVAPWCRYHSFGIGVIIGYILLRCNGKLRIKIWLNILLWLVSFALCFVVLYGPYDVTKAHVATLVESAIYEGWFRVSWSIGLGYVIIACCTGHGGWVNEFLSWRGFVPLSRLTYCAYLMHPVVMHLVTWSNRNLIDFSVLVLIYMFVAYLAMSYAVAFAWSVCIEAPFLNLDRNYITGALMKKGN